jgi:ketosteroid isomerase-like protein
LTGFTADEEAECMHMSQADVRANVQNLFAAFDGNDVDTLTTLVTNDVRLQLMNNEPAFGQQAFASAVAAFHDSVAGIRHEILDVWSDSEAVIVELRVHYTRLDGGEVTLPCCNVFRLRDTRIADYRSYMDITPVYA